MTTPTDSKTGLSDQLIQSNQTQMETTNMTAQNNSETPLVSTGETNISGALLPQPPIPPQVPVEPPKAPMPIPRTAPSSENNVRANPPGWQFQQGAQIAPADARAIIEARVLDESKIYKPAQKLGFARNTVQGPASIVELARALKNDPQLIYEFVYDNIEWEPGFSQQKGSLGCLLDGMGNSFDQTDLLVKLLRQAGFTANFVLGTIKLTEAELMAWFGTSDIWGSAAYCGNENIPYQSPVWNGTGWDMVLSHMWAEVVISGTTYVMDPSRKTYLRTAAVSGLATIIGYTPATFLANATSGATVNTDYVQNMNKANIQSDLTTMTSNLVTWIAANNHSATVDDILGGQSIVPVTLPITFATSLSYQTPGDVPTIWTGNIPLAYQTTLQVQFPDNSGGWCIDQTFTSDQLAGTRLTITYDGSLQPVLKLDGVTIATGIAQGAGTWNSVLLTVVHNGYPVNWYDQQWWQQFIWAGQHYLIGNAWGNLGRGQLDLHIERTAANRAAGGAATSEPIMGETLSNIWFSWASQASRVTDLVGRIMNCHLMNNHQVGIISFNSGGFGAFAGDIGGASGSSTNLNNDVTKTPINDTVCAMHGVALEAAVAAQTTGLTPGVSTTTVIDVANTAGDRIYKGTSSNWTVGSNISAALVANGYSVGDMNNIGGYLGVGYTALLGDQPVRTLGAWSGWADWLFPNSGGFGLINGTFKGKVSQPGGEIEKKPPKTPETTPPTEDPIDTVTGAFLYDKTDLTIGSQGFPYGLAFSRSYSSAAQYTDGPLGRGWTHNHNMAAAVSSNGHLALGERSAAGGAASIVELFIATDILADTARPVEKLVTVSLAGAYWVDVMVNNTVEVTTTEGARTFIKQPDGSYTPPTTVPCALTLSAGIYTVTLIDGVKYNFNASGQISTIVFPNGMTVTYTYTSGKLTSISNGLTRTLTLAYTGTRLTSVSDGTGRSVSFTVDGSANLTQVTDAFGKIYSFVYDQPGRMTQAFKPGSAINAMVTNVYDSLSRVQTQQNARSQTYTYYFAGARTEELDPVGNKWVKYFNRFGYLTRMINALGFEWKTTYDGFNRAIEVVSPEGNKNQATYNKNNQVLSVTAIAKVGSGLSNLSASFTYDAIWNKLKTAIDFNGNTTTNNYDGVTGNLLTIQQPVIGGFTPTSTFTYNARGQVLTAQDQTGVVAQFTYDVTTEKLLTAVKDPGVSPHLALTASFGYDSVGNTTSMTDPRSNQSTVLYDSLRRPTQLTSAAPFSLVTKFTYDDNSNLLKTERQTDNAAEWQTYQFTYSLTDKVLTTTDPMGKVSTVTFDGKDRLQTSTDAQGRQYQFAYDALDRLSQVTDPALVVNDVKTFTANGLLATIKDGLNNQTSFSYDGFDRANKTTYADTSFEQNQSYDNNGRVLTFVTRSGNTVVNTFDVLGRLATKTPQGQPQVTFTYDLASRLTQVSKPVVGGDPSSGALQYFYDTAGRNFKEQYPDGKTVVHVLDANGNPTTTTWPDGYFITRAFDQLNRMTDIFLNGAGAAAAQFSYNKLSQRTKITFNNGSSVVYQPQINGDLTGLTHNFSAANVDFGYGYNDVHELISQSSSDPSFTWHPSGTGTVSYGAADSVHKYPSVGGSAYSYNGNGCLTGDTIWTYGYDTENHLLTANKTGVSASFVYDPSHRQSQKTVGSVLSRYIYSGWQRIADYDGSSGGLQNRYVYGTGLDEPLIQVSAGGTITYYHHDRMGSIVAVSNSSGVTTNVNKFGPYGEVTSLGGTTFGYTAQRYDSELGLYYYKNRYYSPQIGRFLQTDPLGLSAGLNLYEYASSSPLVYSDPLGLEPIFDPFGLLPKFLGLSEGLSDWTFSVPFQGAPAGAYTPQIEPKVIGNTGYVSSEASSGNKEGKGGGGGGGGGGGRSSLPGSSPEAQAANAIVLMGGTVALGALTAAELLSYIVALGLTIEVANALHRIWINAVILGQNLAAHGSFNDEDHLNEKYGKHGRNVGAQNIDDYVDLAEDLFDSRRDGKHRVTNRPDGTIVVEGGLSNGSKGKGIFFPDGTPINLI
jgi:RHS repeat-associated protein